MYVWNPCASARPASRALMAEPGSAKASASSSAAGATMASSQPMMEVEVAVGKHLTSSARKMGSICLISCGACMVLKKWKYITEVANRPAVKSWCQSACPEKLVPIGMLWKIDANRHAVMAYGNTHAHVVRKQRQALSHRPCRQWFGSQTYEANVSIHHGLQIETIHAWLCVIVSVSVYLSCCICSFDVKNFENHLKLFEHTSILTCWTNSMQDCSQQSQNWNAETLQSETL